MKRRCGLGWLVAVVLTVTAGIGWSQGQGGQGGAGGSAPAPTPTPTTPSPGTGTSRTPTGRTPGTTTPGDPTQRSPFPQEMPRQIFLSGKVVMEDGTPPPEPVTIERVCNGQPRPEGYTDSKGRFSFALGQNSAMMMDASVGSPIDGGFPGSSSPLGGGGFGGPGGRGVSERDLMGCELRATLAGHRSDVVQLSGRRVMDNPDVGTIILRRLANVQGMTFSATSYLAPKDAKKAYEKGVEQSKKDKFDNARKELEKAVGLYPKYAAAWYELGVVHQEQKRMDEARKAYEQSLAADDKFVNPYLQLASLALAEQNWEGVAKHTDRVIRLNPVDFPQAFFFNSVAKYNLKQFDDAEKSAAEAVRLDTRHRLPKAQHILGILMAMRNDLNGAAENLRGYLKFAPGAGDADAVGKQLAEIERRLGKAEAAQQQPQQ